MKSFPRAVTIFFLFCLSQALADYPRESQKIDRIVEEKLKRLGITPNPPAKDETFLRRASLDIVGRIPSLEETRNFLDFDGPNKRSALIDYLLKSDGYVSHQFNWWADILRIQSGMRGGAGAAYATWVKNAIKENLPYDQFVRELVTADGMIWDNGATGYYLRDSGMPLDNMSNTTQIFLGTQLVCAQCHNHPFDKWTQIDYYHMAAFTYGVETRTKPEEIVKIDDVMERENKKRKGLRLSRNMRRALDDILEPLSYGTRETDRKVKLPHDYQYDDATPEQSIEPKVLFGEKVRIGKRDNPREEYAAWMTSTENPRFAKVIANRLWKRVFGIGLVEPVDNFTDSTVASNPELLNYLETLFVQLKYDQKAFLRILYHTRTYQREATPGDVPTEEPYYFPGPVLRRMSAEQYWDSLLVLSIPKPDQRFNEKGTRYQLEQMKEKADALRARNPKEILAQAEAAAKVMDDADAISSRIRRELLAAEEADDGPKIAELRKSLRANERQKDEKLKKVSQSAREGGMMMESNEMSLFEQRARERELARAKAEAEARKQAAKKAGRPAEKIPEDPWKGFGTHLMRASELPSPAPSGHFLREFGQSDRETIENANTEASVAQALSLLNGKTLNDVLNPKSPLMRAIAGASTLEEKRDAIFLSLFTRNPSAREKTLVEMQLEAKGEAAWEAIIYALLNGTEFGFVR